MPNKLACFSKRSFLKAGFHLLIFAVLFFAIRYYQLRDHLSIEQVAPKITLTQYTNGKLNNSYPSFTSDYKTHKRHLIYFFAPWCNVCHLSLPSLQWLKSGAWHDTQILLVALSWEDIEAIEDFFGDEIHKFTVLLGNKQTQHTWAISGFPTYYVVNDKGQIISRDKGYTSPFGLWYRTL
ncbi:MAG: redoxin family protein [Pseudomonadota bacterium]